MTMTFVLSAPKSRKGCHPYTRSSCQPVSGLQIAKISSCEMFSPIKSSAFLSQGQNVFSNHTW